MKCMECHLCTSDWDYSDSDGDVFCMADTTNQEIPDYLDFDIGGCRRTNKWILAQDPKRLKDTYLEKEAESWAEYAGTQ